jgi:vacuolar-type H+-ATPase subunit F/Vma7
MINKLNLTQDELKDIAKTKDILIALITKNVAKHIPKVLKNAKKRNRYSFCKVNF